MKYRLDIDGLRAIAVCMVIGFHLDLTMLSGGHVGVDVFFVISGFLITSIISNQVRQNAFSFFEFYSKRICRLLPALYTTVLATFIAANFILFPDDMARLARSAVATIFSASNVLFWSESGYWDVASNSKALLHTWSLGVEEQFYLIWPAALLGLYKFSSNPVRALSFIAVVGLVLCYLYSLIDVSGAFYLLPARVFQFASGAVLAAYLHRHPRPTIFSSDAVRRGSLVLGLVLVSGVAVLLDESDLYPGGYAVIPTMGTVLIILAGSSPAGQPLLGRVLLENKVALWIGKASYSLYLVHWPIIVFYRYTHTPELSVSDILLIILMIVVSGTLLHYLVERKFYAGRFSVGQMNSKNRSKPKAVLHVFASGVFVTLIAGHAWANDGWPWRFKGLAYSVEDIKKAGEARLLDYASACFVDQWASEERCRSKNRRTILFLGNSHEPDGFNFMRAGYPEQMRSSNVINFGTINECTHLAPVDGKWVTADQGCQQRLLSLFNPEFIAELDLIIYSAHHTFRWWNHRPWEMVRDIKAINPDVKVVVIGDYLETKVPCARVINEQGSNGNCFATENIAYEASNVEEQELYPTYKQYIDLYIDQLDLLCEGPDFSSCKFKTEYGVLYSYDNHHKSLEFSGMAGRMYAKRHASLFEN